MKRAARRCTATCDVDLKQQFRGGDRPGPGGKCAHLKPGNIAHCIDLIHREAVKKPVADHCGSALAEFFGGLKDKHGAAIEIARVGKPFCRPKRHCHMHLKAKAPHPFDDTRRDVPKIKLKLGMTMKPVPPFGHLVA
ncbi:MAG: hypothetical protein RQ750_01615 [Roseovarius sp.]|nr:hypothetical protein [Roseovarius sp.]